MAFVQSWVAGASRNEILVTGASLAALVALGALWRLRPTRRAAGRLQDGEHGEILLPNEASWVQMENVLGFPFPPPITSMTWFCGDHHAAAKILRRRCMEIVSKNAWLGGKIARREGNTIHNTNTQHELDQPPNVKAQSMHAKSTQKLTHLQTKSVQSHHPMVCIQI